MKISCLIVFPWQLAPVKTVGLTVQTKTNPCPEAHEYISPFQSNPLETFSSRPPKPRLLHLGTTDIWDRWLLVAGPVLCLWVSAASPGPHPPEAGSPLPRSDNWRCLQTRLNVPWTESLDCLTPWMWHIFIFPWVTSYHSQPCSETSIYLCVYSDFS